MNDGATEVLAPSGPAITQLAAVPTTPAAVLMHAMAHGGSMEQIEKLLDLQMKWEANEARKAYVADMAEFKKNPPTIYKDKQVAFDSKVGRTSYRHASIGNVVEKVVSALAQHGFSHNWDTNQEGGKVIVTCKITHRLGHSESVTIEAAPDQSGGKNSIQAIISAQSYLQRHSLLAACGLATHDQPDDDGAAAGQRGPSLSETWCKAAANAANLPDLQKVWDSGVVAISEAQDEEAYNQFKAACNARKAELEQKPPAQPGRSSRVAGIIKGNQQAAQAGG